jgi:hypothetical protein
VPITTDGVSSNLDPGEVCNIMWQVGVFFTDTPVSSTNKIDRHNIAEKWR